MRKKVNEDYSGGRVGKTELASLIFLYFEKKGLAAAVEVIRTEFLDQVQYLGNVVKELRSMQRSGS